MDGQGDNLRLSRAAQRRAMVLNQLLAGELTNAQAAELLGLSVRQIKRVRAAYRTEGPAALVHGNAGRVPWHALPVEIRQRVLELASDRYAGLNYQHLSEKLADEGIDLHRTTLRKLLLEAGLRGPRTRRAPPHRRRRERMPREGQLLQADGSRHRWLGTDVPYLTLIGAIDDATGTVPAAVFRAQEDAAGYFELLQAIVLTKGLPLALYVDRHGIFKKSVREPLTLDEELAGGPLPTQVGRALAELGIGIVYALSPQAKGRVERLWGTLQDRLVAELRLADVHTMDVANAFLPRFLEEFNRRFGIPSAEPGSAYRCLPTALDVERICCFKYEREVGADNTVTFGSRVLQLTPTRERASWARVRVEVHERLHGSLAVLHNGSVLTTTPAPLDTPTLRARRTARPGLKAQWAFEAPLTSSPSAKPTGKPAPNHPWRSHMTSHRRLPAEDQ